MKRIRRLLVALAGTLVLASTPAAANWTGCYGELGIGMEVVNTKLDAVVSGASLAALDGLGSQGIMGSLGVGCDYNVDKVVVGIVGRYEANRAETTLSIAANEAKLKFDPGWMVGARVGILGNQTTLLYALIGYSQSKVKVDGLGADLGADLKGMTFGAGIETVLSGPWAMKLEYAFTRWDSASVYNSGPLDVRVSPDQHVVRGAVVYRFGNPMDIAK